MSREKRTGILYTLCPAATASVGEGWSNISQLAGPGLGFVRRQLKKAVALSKRDSLLKVVGIDARDGRGETYEDDAGRERCAEALNCSESRTSSTSSLLS